jgi:3-oxoacyl-[acyl-carrier protein] reductase
MTFDLAGKRILVTGASRGLGRAMCRLFAELGARVAFTFTNDEGGARETLAAIHEHGDGLVFQVSVLDGPGTDEMLEKIGGVWGGIDVLVNNAAISQPLPIALLEEEDWDRVMDTNVKGVYVTTRAVLRWMIRQRSGVILNIGSVAGLRALDAPVHYCASKAAIVGFTLALSKQVARYSIRVNCLAPGLLEDGVGRSLPAHRVEEYVEHCSLGRVGTLDEAARVAAMLVSDTASYVNGEIVRLDGGL